MGKCGHGDKCVFIHDDGSAKHEESESADHGHWRPYVKRKSARPKSPSHSPPARCRVAHEPVPAPATPEIELPPQRKKRRKTHHESSRMASNSVEGDFAHTHKDLQHPDVQQYFRVVKQAFAILRPSKPEALSFAEANEVLLLFGCVSGQEVATWKCWLEEVGCSEELTVKGFLQLCVKFRYSLSMIEVKLTASIPSIPK